MVKLAIITVSAIVVLVGSYFGYKTITTTKTVEEVAVTETAAAEAVEIEQKTAQKLEVMKANISNLKKEIAEIKSSSLPKQTRRAKVVKLKAELQIAEVELEVLQEKLGIIKKVKAKPQGNYQAIGGKVKTKIVTKVQKA